MLRIIEHIGDKNLMEFKQNTLVVDAVIRNFEIIGEASKNLPDDIKKKYPTIPWNKMYGLRNLILHEYFGVDYEMIWEIVKKSLPQNITDIRNLIDTESK